MGKGAFPGHNPRSNPVRTPGGILGTVYGAMDFAQGYSTNKGICEDMEGVYEFYNRFFEYYNLATTMFKWELPETCSERFFEQVLLTCGKGIIAEKEGSYITLAANTTGLWNIYGYAVQAWGWGLNGFNELFNLWVEGAEDAPVLRQGSGGVKAVKKNWNAVLCRDNISEYPYINYIFATAQRVADSIRAIDTTVENLKNPIIITCEESQKETAEAILAEKKRNHSAILSYGSLGMDSIKIWDAKSNPETLKALWENADKNISVIREWLGIDASPEINKAERLVVSEAESNDEAIQHNLNIRLKERERFCRHAKMAFPDLDISVRLATPKERMEAIEDGMVSGRDSSGAGSEETPDA